jgi:hypothetical protein
MITTKQLFRVHACWALLLACGSEASPGQLGEPLTLQGTAEIEDGQTEGKLQPALAFRIHTPQGDQLHFARVDIEGELAADFMLHITKRPSQKVIEATRRLYESAPDYRPPFPIAYLAVVTDDLPGIIYAEPSASGQICAAGPPCTVQAQWCVNSAIEGFDDDECYREHRTCAAGAFSYDDCATTSAEGNPDVRGYPWKRLAGLSEDLRIFYLSEALAADDPVAIQFELPALEAGYHALEVIGPTPEELEDAEACKRMLYEEGIVAYNAAHETEYTYDEIAQCWSDLYHLESCADDGERAVVWRAARERVIQGNVLSEDLPCAPFVEPRRRLLPPKELHSIFVRIGPDIAPSADSDHDW